MTLARLDSLAAAALEMLWRASWQAAVLTGMVLLAQWLLRGRLSARWRYNLWIIVILRLLVPVTPQSSLSVFNISNRFTHPAPAVVSLPTPLVAHDVISSSEVTAFADAHAGTASPVAPSHVRHAPIPWFIILASAWITGALVLLARMTYASIRLSRCVRGMTAVDDPKITQMLDRCRDDLAVRRRIAVLSSDDLPAPALMGAIRPRLLLPRCVIDQFQHDELRLILLHELAHLKRNDVLVNWVVALLGALHWFNPILWIAFARLRADRELATDELVLSRTGEVEKIAYGDTIVKLLQSLARPRSSYSVPMVGTVGILERAHLLRRRITMIAHFQSASLARRWTIVAVIMMLVLAGFGLTDAVRGDDAEPRKPLSAPKSVTPATSPPTTAPVDDQVRAAIDEVMTKALAKHVPPTAQDMDEAMKELASKIRAKNLIVSAQGKPVNEARVNDDIRRAQQLLSDLAGKSAAAPGSPAATPAETTATLRKLAANMPEVHFDAMPFSDAIDFLRDVTNLNFFVNWRALEAAGFDRNAPVTVRLNNVPFEQALRYILRDAGGGTIELDYAVIDGIVNISTAEELARDTTVHVYSVAKLLKEMPTTMPSANGEEIIRSDKAQRLIQLICETIAPDTWRQAGGTAGSISEINGRLVITQTEANHALIQKLLDEIGAKDAPGDSAAIREAEPIAAHK